MKLPELDYSKISEKIANFIKDNVKEANSNGVVLGLSGGLDSVCVAYLACKALGSENVMAVCLPNSTTPEEDLLDAREVAKILEIEYREIDIDDILDSFLVELDEGNELSVANLKARIRMSIVYFYANLKGRMVIGTSNKSEMLYGYFTKYGDGASDFIPIANLYKSQVFQLSKHLGIPEEIISKPPRAGLTQNQTDESEIGMTYDKLDLLLYMVNDLKLSNEDIINNMKISSSEINRVRDKIKNSKHKNEFPPKAKL